MDNVENYTPYDTPRTRAAKQEMSKGVNDSTRRQHNDRLRDASWETATWATSALPVGGAAVGAVRGAATATRFAPKVWRGVKGAWRGFTRGGNKIIDAVDGADAVNGLIN